MSLLLAIELWGIAVGEAACVELARVFSLNVDHLRNQLISCLTHNWQRDALTYGAYRPQDGVCERALFVIDSNGVIHWSYVSPIGINPGADGILNALEELNPQREEKTDEHSFNRQARALSERA